jgi:hypothetical protein
VADVWRALRRIDDFAEGSSIFSDDDDDLAYFVNGTQVANLVGDQLGLRLTRKVISAHRARLKTNPHVDLLRSGGDWIAVSLAADLPFVLELAELAAAAHRPADGVTAKPPPAGAELARRRRFH